MSGPTGNGVRPKEVEIVEVGPRDGLQNDPQLVPTDVKIELIRRLAATGLRRIEATSFVHPKRVPQMADAEEVVRRLGDIPHLRLSALVLNERGFDRALATGAFAEITFAAVASETFSQRNQGATVQENLETWRAISRRAEAAGLFRSVTIAAAFGCPFEGEVPVARVADLARAVADIGTEELSLADTIGVGGPADVEIRFAAIRDAAPGMKLRAHFHNTRNTGYANADAALRMGVSALDASLGGMGGCPFAPEATGNIGTEDLVYMLDRSGVASGVAFAGLRDTTAWLEERMGRRLPAQTAHCSIFPPVPA
ncbi:hydroxymethylglutaryl-CoA lyase [Enterovirga aerilata]|uniref:Hydroxymethylglutaryl-CoA lyase n=1 Tax=Enterovirga aerilata TaxID=2730920 RepID=A0A849HZZ9_9HYPH|nr:hydroxymethylglutaryl-CoA lyase [Enterovirga sp. DB1703]NNM73096.1 hydroxymethylglutaryl-CoA lyase [Enterovirga sp. DB1703]